MDLGLASLNYFKELWGIGAVPSCLDVRILIRRLKAGLWIGWFAFEKGT